MRVLDALTVEKRMAVPPENRFAHPTPEGYMDALAVIDLGGGIKAEVQISIPEMMRAKETGHVIYEEMRSAGDIISHPDAELQITGWREAMKSLYGAALDANRAARSRNSASSMSEGGALRANSEAGIQRSSPAPSTQLSPRPGMNTTGSPSSAKNFAPGGNTSGTGTAGSFGSSSALITPSIRSSGASDNQNPAITRANVRDFIGTLAVSDTALPESAIWRVFNKEAFDGKPDARMIPVEKLVSRKDEREDKQYQAGTKDFPVKNAYVAMVRNAQGRGEQAGRDPIRITANKDGTFEILDGNATSQVLMAAGWREVPAILEAPENAPAMRGARDTGTGDLFAENAVRKNDEPRIEKKTPDEIPRTDRRLATPPAKSSGVDDLFSLMAGRREAQRSARVDAGGQGDLFAASGRASVGDVADRQSDQAGTGRLGGSAQDGDPRLDGDGQPRGDRPGGREAADAGGTKGVAGDSGRGDPPRVERPAAPVDRNYVIPRGHELSPRGLTSKLRANVEAIRLLKQIESEKRPATQAERDALVKYSGWGALSQAFDADKAERIAGGEIETRRETAERYRGYITDRPGSEYYRSDRPFRRRGVIHRGRVNDIHRQQRGGIPARETILLGDGDRVGRLELAVAIRGDGEQAGQLRGQVRDDPLFDFAAEVVAHGAVGVLT